MESSNYSFVAINYITCESDYRERFEELFRSRAKAIDRHPGFISMEVLKPGEQDGTYLVLSRWEDEESFKKWTNSPEFIEGHKRGFEDIRKAREEGRPAPMRSDFKTYNVISR